MISCHYSPLVFALTGGISGCPWFLSTQLHLRNTAVLLKDVSGSQLPGWQVFSFAQGFSSSHQLPFRLPAQQDVSDLRGWVCKRHPRAQGLPVVRSTSAPLPQKMVAADVCSSLSLGWEPSAQMPSSADLSQDTGSWAQPCCHGPS